MELLARGTAASGFHCVLGLLVVPSVIGVFVSPGARPPVVLLDVTFPAFAAVAAHGVDARVRAQRLVAGGTLVDIQAVGLLAPPVSLPVVPEPGVAGAQHSAEVVGALLLTGGLGAHVVIFWDALSKNKFISLAAFFPETGGELTRRLQTRVFRRGDLVF